MQYFNSFDHVDSKPEFGSPLSVAISGRDHETMQMVRRAVETGQVMLAYQPIVRACNPERPAFYEGLLRVLDHTGRIIPAGDFMDVVEAKELGRQIDTWAIDLGFRALAENPELRLGHQHVGPVDRLSALDDGAAPGAGAGFRPQAKG